MANLAYTWLGHATFLIASPGGKKVLIDPWVTGNPMSPDSAKNIGHVDLVLVTPFELSLFFQRKGLQQVTGMNPGGTLHTLGLSITMVQAFHSSSIEEDG